jgi:ribosomal protein L29
MNKQHASEGFVRARNNKGALVNVQQENYDAYKKERQHLSEVKNNIGKINTIENELNGLKEDMSEIKQLLLKVLNK